MNLLEKLLQDNNDFLQDVTKITLQGLQAIKEECNREIIDYHPLNNGHMLRPLLVYITACSFGENITNETKRKLTHFAAVVELMHNASLLHDDLLDQSEFRRGKPCLYKKHGFKNGLLVGNIYYIKAIELSNNTLEYKQTADLLNAAIAMCEGEILQAHYEDKLMPENIYDRIIRYKTGSLTALACRQAAQIMQADERTVALFGELGEELGVMYQLRDDRKDNDVNLGDRFEYAYNIDLCSNRITSLMRELSQMKISEQFEEIITYFKKN